ncbi:MAG: hypothetical protein M1481_04895 [Candidatus Thermoplasmatota archaeon]|nr:hypothetical protein [Candidatus Thermoplasmatota archaeon]MCL5963060.1 hypothetical protein [Candidatus Thermoplasmatota archaeon]
MDKNTYDQFGYDEAIDFILNFLKKNGKVTTDEVENATKKVGKRCPDATVLFLATLKMKGIIKGEFSESHHGWVWWV